MTGILNLPEEILINIFGLLPPSDLKTVMLVSKQWTLMGKTPTLWTWATTATLKYKDDLQKLKFKRLRNQLKKIKVTNWFESSSSILKQSTAVRPEELFNALLPITTLTSIEGLTDDSSNDLGSISFTDFTDHPDLSVIDPELFASVLSRLNYLSFNTINPSPSQYEALLSSISQKDSHVKKLVFGFHRIFAPPDVFAAAVSNVDECDLGTCPVPFQDMQALCVAVAENQGQLKKLNMFSSFLASIDPDILGTAISSLESVRIYQESDLLSKDQIAAILRKAGGDGSKLKKLDIIMREEQKEELDQELLRQAGQKIGAVKWTPVQLRGAHYVLTICARA